MTLALSEHLPLIASAPGGIQKLRGLILELAVRGKLVPQNPNEEPASELLKRIAKQRDLHHAVSTRKRTSKTSLSTDNCWPFSVPHGWEWSRVVELSDVIRGVSYEKSQASENSADGFVPLLRGHNINQKLNFDDVVFVPSPVVSEEQIIRQGDIVIAMSSGSAHLVGKAAQAESNTHCGFGAFCGVIRAFSEELHPYFGFFFQTPLYRTRVAGQGKGIGINNLQKGALLALECPIPPLAEQHRIVAKVDELMVLCDRLESEQNDSATAQAQLVETLLGTLTQSTDSADFEANWQRIAAHFDTLFTTETSIDALQKTILQLAVIGKLVTQDPNDNPAAALVQRISAERSRLEATGELRASRLESLRIKSNQPVPTGWELTSFGLLTFNRDGERIPVSKDDRNRREKIYDYYGASGIIDKIDGYLFDKPLLLIGEDGANLINRSTPIAFIAKGKYWVNNHAHVIDAISEELLEYLELYINSIDLKPYVTGTAQPKMNQAKMNSIPVCLPPEAEQRRIVAKVKELMAVCDSLKNQLTESRKQEGCLADTLIQASLKAA